MNRQRGVGLIGLILFVVVVAVIIFAGDYVYNKHFKADTPAGYGASKAKEIVPGSP